MRSSARLSTPVGDLLAIADGENITHLLFADGEQAASLPPLPPTDEARFDELRTQLESYFAGDRTQFDLKLAPPGTDFQRRVWSELERIPFGETISYGELANRIGSPKAVRAVGGANNKNPIPIVIPCHRVVGKNNTLVGYGGGLDRKHALLRLEGAELAAQLRLEGF